MENHPIENLMTSTMENIKKMIDVNAIIGDAVEAKDGTLIIPVSKVSFGFTSGGAEYGKQLNNKFPFGGGSGAGVSIKPVAFLVIKSDSSIRLLSTESDATYDKILDTIPQITDLIKNMIKSKDKKCTSETSKQENTVENNQ